MVEFTPHNRPRGTDVHDDTGETESLRRPYTRVEPIDEPRAETHAGTPDTGADRREAIGPARQPFGREHRDTRSLGDLLRELLREGRDMLRQEVHLARAEVRQNVRSVGRHAAAIAIGGAVAYAGLLTIIGAAALGAFVLLAWAGVDSSISLWLGPLIVGIIVAIVGYAMLKSGMNKLQDDDLVPDKTAQTMRENAQWMQQRMK